MEGLSRDRGQNRKFKTTLEDIGVNLIIDHMRLKYMYTIAGRRHSNGFDRVNAHKTGSGSVLVGAGVTANLVYSK